MDIFIFFGFVLFMVGIILMFYFPPMRKIEVKYWVSIVISLICLLEIIGVSTSSDDLYAIFMYQIITAPLGIISFLVSLIIQRMEKSKEKWKTYTTIGGIILGLITAILPIVLFKMGMMLR